MKRMIEKDIDKIYMNFVNKPEEHKEMNREEIEKESNAYKHLNNKGGKKMKYTIINWVCPHCNHHYKSYSREHHKMDMCSCGKCGVDHEVDYTRILGDAKIITEYKEVKK